MRAAIEESASALCEGGALISPHLVVREHRGFFWAEADRTDVDDGQTLVDYSNDQRPRLDTIQWSLDGDEIVAGEGIELLDMRARRLVEAWLVMIQRTGKITQAKEQVPALAVSNWRLREHLAAGGFPGLLETPTEHDVISTVIAWHATGAGPRDSLPRQDIADPSIDGGRPLRLPGRRRWFLIPIKCFVNHHSKGARQQVARGRVTVVARRPTATDEIFENYGDLDSLQLLMNFGFVDNSAGVVHSVPVSVESRVVGRVSVLTRPPRKPGVSREVLDTPLIRPVEDGLQVRHLALRPGNLAKSIQLLAMAIQAHRRVTADAAANEAQAVIDAILEANLDYYSELNRLAARNMNTPTNTATGDFGSSKVLPLILSVSRLQERRLLGGWGAANNSHS